MDNYARFFRAGFGFQAIARQSSWTLEAQSGNMTYKCALNSVTKDLLERDIYKTVSTVPTKQELLSLAPLCSSSPSFLSIDPSASPPLSNNASLRPLQANFFSAWSNQYLGRS